MMVLVKINELSFKILASPSYSVLVEMVVALGMWR
jgi:hypothetical protein